MLVEVSVESLGLDRTTKSPVVVLRESGGDRALPIWIGPGEASAIHMHMADISVGRPLTHDLLVSVIRDMGGTLSRVVITRVQKNTYFAELHVRIDGRAVTVDARPSDSIAIALRTGSPIFADESLLDLIRMEVEDEDTTLPTSGPGAGTAETEEPGGEGLTASELEEYLRKMDPEDFGRFSP